MSKTDLDEYLAKEYLHTRNRICHARYAERQSNDEFICKKCILKDFCAPSDNEEEILKSIEIVDQWAKEHPEKKRKTYAEDFFSKYPNAPHDFNSEGEIIEIPYVCRQQIYGDMDSPCCGGGCAVCWNEEMEDEDKP